MYNDKNSRSILKKKLYYFTVNFPYGRSEKTFVIPEIEILKNYYDITIVSRVNRRLLKSKKDITIINRDITNLLLQEVNILTFIFYGFIGLFDQCFWKDIINIFKLKKNILKRVLASVKMYVSAKMYYYFLKKHNIFSDIDNSIYYTFWNNYTVLSLCWFKRKYKNMKIISRAHGYDLFNQRLLGGRQPYKWYMNNFENAIIFVSEQGKNYYKENYKENIDKVKLAVSYLGIKDLYNNDVERKGNFKLVSCSNVIKLKRIEYIIKALSVMPLNINIDWVHFGDGSEMNNISVLAEMKLKNKSNIRYKLYGYVNNSDIISYYRQNYVDCFITTSSTEGLPVSIMEALMFRIPIIATNVGGIKEQIDNNGVLLKANPTIDEIKDAIIYIYNNKNIEELKNNSRMIYKNKFNIEKNVDLLIEILDE